MLDVTGALYCCKFQVPVELKMGNSVVMYKAQMRRCEKLIPEKLLDEQIMTSAADVSHCDDMLQRHAAGCERRTT